MLNVKEAIQSQLKPHSSKIERGTFMPSIKATNFATYSMEWILML